MPEDTLLAEVHRVRARLLSQAGGDLDRLMDHIARVAGSLARPKRATRHTSKPGRRRQTRRA